MGLLADLVWAMFLAFLCGELSSYFMVNDRTTNRERIKCIHPIRLADFTRIVKMHAAIR